MLLLPRAFLQTVAQQNQQELPAVLECPQSGALLDDSLANRRLRAHLQQLLASGQSGMDEDACYSLALLLLETAQPEPGRGFGPTAGQHALALKQCLELIEARASEGLTVSELSHSAQVPLRSLTRAFREHFGIGPKAYINQLRLGRVRRDLQCASSEKISTVAMQHGFWHMGQFAREYYRQFGELPSETVGRSARKLPEALVCDCDFYPIR